MQAAQTALLVSVADALINCPPPHALVTLEQARSEVAVGLADSYVALMMHGGDVAVHARSDDTVTGAAS